MSDRTEMLYHPHSLLDWLEEQGFGWRLFTRHFGHHSYNSAVPV